MGLGSLGQVVYDILANDKTSSGVGSAQKGFDGLVTTLGDLKDSFKEIDDIAQKISHKYASLSSYAEQAALSTGLTADATTDLIKELWSVDTPLEEAGNLIIELGRAGLTSEGDIRTVGAACDTLGDALGIPADSLANMLIPAFKAFGLQATDIPSKIDEIAYTLKTCDVNFGEWQKTLVKLGPDLAGMGLSIEDVNALLLVMKDHGIQGRNMLTELNKAMSESSDTNKDGKISLDEIAAALGITTDEIGKQKEKLEGSSGTAQKWADAANKMYTASDNFAQSVEELSTKLGPLADNLAAITGPVTFVAEALLSLVALKALGIGGILSGISSAFSGLGGALAGLATTIGSGLVAAITSAIAIAIGAVLTGIGIGLATVWVMVKTGIMDLISKIGQSIGSFLSGSNLGQIVKDQLVVVLTPVTLLGSAILDIVKGDFENLGTHLGEVLITSLSSLGDWFSQVKDLIVASFSGVVDGIGGIVGNIPGIITGAFEGILGTISSILSGIPGALASAFKDIVTAFSALGGSVQGAFSDLFKGISDFIVGLAQGFVSAGYNIIMFIVQGMQQAAGKVSETILNILGGLAKFLPHSPAEEGPLSVLPNFQAYFVDPLLAVTPAVQSAAVQVAAAATLPAAAAETTTNSTSTVTTDNSVSIGNVNASKDYSISDIMAEIATMQALKRTQRGITTG